MLGGGSDGEGDGVFGAKGVLCFEEGVYINERQLSSSSLSRSR